jgi:hypothetical protein
LAQSFGHDFYAPGPDFKKIPARRMDLAGIFLYPDLEFTSFSLFFLNATEMRKLKKKCHKEADSGQKTRFRGRNWGLRAYC